MCHQWTGTRVAVLALAFGVAAWGCAPREDSATADSLMGDTTGAMSTAGGDVMNEAATLGTVAAVHSSEIAAGELAQERAQNARVKQFAQRITQEHRAGLQQLEAMNASYDTTQADPMLVQMADSTMQRLRNLRGAAFDTAWVNAQVAMHESVLQRLEAMAGRTGTAGRENVGEYVGDTRELIEQHLEAARELQQQLRGGSQGR